VLVPLVVPDGLPYGLRMVVEVPVPVVFRFEVPVETCLRPSVATAPALCEVLLTAIPGEVVRRPVVLTVPGLVRDSPDVVLTLRPLNEFA
jgi:hypothetical protein